MKKNIFLLLLIYSSMKAIDQNTIVIALGENCEVSAATELFNLKKASYPFEWCVTPVNSLLNSLKNDFDDFTNPTYFTRYVDNKSPVNKYGICLAHDFPIVPDGLNATGQEKFKLDPEWRKYLPEVQKKYQRRIDRFHNACQSDKNIFFIRYQIDESGARALSNLISELYPNLNFTLVCVRILQPESKDWHIANTKNYYIDSNNPNGSANEWRKIFIKAGLIEEHRSLNYKDLQKTYEDIIINHQKKRCIH